MARDNTLIHVERQALFTAMHSPAAFAEMRIESRHFASEAHGLLWQALTAQAVDSKPMDMVSVADYCERMGDKRTGTLAYEIGCANDLAVSTKPAYVSGLIVQGWRDREAMRIARDLLEAAGTRTEGAVDAAIAALMGLHHSESESEHTASGALVAAWQAVAAAHEAGGALLGIPTGIRGLDEVLGGFHDSDLVIVGARPAMGKTGFLLSSVLAGSGVGAVGLISGEQPHDQVGLRWLAGGSGVSIGRMRAGKIDEHHWPQITEAVKALKGRPIRIYDRSGPDIAEVIRVARRWKHQFGIKALYVDYLQRLEASGMDRAPKHERVGYVAKSLKNLARDLQIPVIALAQVSRDAGDERPQMHHLSDSSEIEKEADQIMMLWRDKSQTGPVTPAEINVVKNRHGQTGVVHCVWMGDKTAFVDGEMEAA
jgi:replicative DNA helicase